MSEAQQQRRQSLRKDLRQQRQALSESQQTLAASKLLQNLEQQSWFLSIESVALYWPNDGEISTKPLIERLHQRGVTVYLPQVTDGNSMKFVQFKKGEKLHAGKWGIMTPPQAGESDDSKIPEIIMLPAVGVDRRGNRLGRGGGFYDRYIASLTSTQSGSTLDKTPNQIDTKKVTLICLAHHLQLVDNIPSEPWDSPVDAIVTDQDFIRCQ